MIVPLSLYDLKILFGYPNTQMLLKEYCHLLNGIVHFLKAMPAIYSHHTLTINQKTCSMLLPPAFS